VSKYEKTTVTFDGCVVASGQPMAGRNEAIAAAKKVWAESVPTQGEWQDHISLSAIVEVLFLTFGSPFEGEVDGLTAREWYAWKIGGFVK